MKTKTLLGLVAAFFLLSGTAFAFHAGGVAHCDGCHSMHNSADNPVFGTPNSQLLKGSDASSTCLDCHAGTGGYHVASDAGLNMNSGGDFYWMGAGAEYTGPPGWFGGPTVTSDNDNHGHNIIAANFGYAKDANPDNQFAPGGNYPAASLGCTSCHDPHGQVNGGTGGGNSTPAISASGSYGAGDPVGSIVGNYRLLGDVGYITDGVTFTNDVPIARANGSSGASVDYGQGMSEWCANCHVSFLVSSSASFKHPSGNTVKLGAFVGNYNSYVASGDFTGIEATAYDALVPIERAEGDRTLLDETSTFGADVNSNVMCLSCHRAHSSAFDNALRWDPTTEFVGHADVLNPLTTFVDGTAPGSHNAYYALGAKVDLTTTYGEWQRSLCNKCHVKD